MKNVIGLTIVIIGMSAIITGADNELLPVVLLGLFVCIIGVVFLRAKPRKDNSESRPVIVVRMSKPEEDSIVERYHHVGFIRFSDTPKGKDVHIENQKN